MTLVLKDSDNLQVKTWGAEIDGGLVHIGQYEVTLNDFCEMVVYVLTNTNLAPHDARLELMNLLAEMEQVRGHGGQGFRLSFPMTTETTKESK